MGAPDSPVILLAGGGTGGHLFPGLALAAALRQRNHAVRILFVGSREGLEQTIVPAVGYALHLLSVGRGSPVSLRRPANLFRFARALGECYLLFSRLRPSLVVGLGGYAAAVPGLLARLTGVPLVLLEQNAIPGRVTRFLSRWASEIHLQFDAARAWIPQGKAQVVESGSPLRPELVSFDAAPAGSRPRLLVVGGSQGAERLNRLAIEARLNWQGAGIPVTHLAGERDAPWVREAVGETNASAWQVEAFCTEMAPVYRQTRLALARAGASTLAELAAAGIPALLVPYPAARDNHQAVNARVYEKAGAALVLSEAGLTAPALAGTVEALWKDPARLAAMSAAMRRLARPEAADAIAASALRRAGIVPEGTA